jgi:hypothetical protein
MVSAQISSPLERVLFLCAECHPLLSHFKELTVILAHMAPGTVSERSFPYIQLRSALIHANKKGSKKDKKGKESKILCCFCNLCPFCFPLSLQGPLGMKVSGRQRDPLNSCFAAP